MRSIVSVVLVSSHSFFGRGTTHESYKGIVFVCLFINLNISLKTVKRRPLGLVLENTDCKSRFLLWKGGYNRIRVCTGLRFLKTHDFCLWRSPPLFVNSRNTLSFVFNWRKRSLSYLGYLRTNSFIIKSHRSA